MSTSGSFQQAPETSTTAQGPQSITMYQACTHQGPLPLPLPSPHFRLRDESLNHRLNCFQHTSGLAGLPSVALCGSEDHCASKDMRPSHPHLHPCPLDKITFPRNPPAHGHFTNCGPVTRGQQALCRSPGKKVGPKGWGAVRQGRAPEGPGCRMGEGVTQDPHGSSPRVIQGGAGEGPQSPGTMAGGIPTFCPGSCQHPPSQKEGCLGITSLSFPLPHLLEEP